MSAALVNRSLSTLKTELEFLRDSDVITEDFYNQIVKRLPDRYQQGSAPIGFDAPTGSTQDSASGKQESRPLPSVQQQPQQEIRPPQPPQPTVTAEYVEALYNYQPQEQGDLELHVGDKVKVLEHTSPDWWKGENGSKVGMFPANYVKKLIDNERQSAPSPAPSYQSSTGYQQFNAPVPQNNNFSNDNKNNMPYPPAGVVPYQQYQSPPPQQVVYAQPQAVQQQPVQQNPHGHSGLHKFGSKLGNAAIFGAGATIGSDLVNRIF